MSDWIYSVVLIVPAEHQFAANALGEAMGWGPNSYTVALSPNGQAPATHYACRPLVTDEFVDLLAHPSEEALAAGAGAILEVLIRDVRVGVEGMLHFNQVAANNGLQVITE